MQQLLHLILRGRLCYKPGDSQVSNLGNYWEENGPEMHAMFLTPARASPLRKESSCVVRFPCQSASRGSESLRSPAWDFVYRQTLKNVPLFLSLPFPWSSLNTGSHLLSVMHLAFPIIKGYVSDEAT